MLFIQLSLPGSLEIYNGNYEVNSNELWTELLKGLIGGDYDILFNNDGKPKPFIAIYLNKNKVLDLNGLHCHDKDSLLIISATSGG
ncbi:hypothetical protein B1207_14385 [Legionella quinlivanii]|uniref:MoaD/ThiS family protein n=1 Tax=Legionella quinlivanii TaxID=45073 RepID=A0A364LFQ7_9GAMM|nr:hypothetical protein [Legionella quinlivanii]RAP34878.1 hypothetical protein B1207_14385 [Legionella quinlivanii]